MQQQVEEEQQAREQAQEQAQMAEKRWQMEAQEREEALLGAEQVGGGRPFWEGIMARVRNPKADSNGTKSKPVLKIFLFRSVLVYLDKFQ